MAGKSGLLTALKYTGLLMLASVASVLLLIAGLVYRNSSTADEKVIRFLYSSFYLKVEDQNGEPVRNAFISYTNGHNYWLGSNSSYAQTTTDSEGLVRFYLDGRQFDVREILSDGYHIDFRPQLDLVSEDQLARLYPAQLKQFDKSSPLVIRAWKMGEAEKLNRGAGRFSLANEEAVQFSLLKNQNTGCLRNKSFPCRKKLSLFGGPQEGRIIVTISKVGGNTDFRKSLGWSLSISVPSGGIVEVDDLYLYEAPATGYAPQWRLSHRRKTADEFIPDFLGRTHKFYVSLEDGKYFGRLYLDMRPFYRENSMLWIEYFVNAEGGRNLDSALRDFATGADLRRHFNYEYRERR